MCLPTLWPVLMLATVGITWHDHDKVHVYVERVGRLAARRAGEAELIEALPESVNRVLDIGLADLLPTLGAFDVVVSGFAIHHLPHERKRSLFAEIAGALRPGVQEQLTWMREAGLEQVDCNWRWRGFALLVGQAARG